MSVPDTSVPPLPPAPPSSFGGKGCLKALLIGCGGLVALFIVLAIVAGILLSRNDDDGLGNRTAARDGARFGLVRDENACFEEAQRRVTAGGAFSSTFQTGIFFRSCLEYSQPTEGFCDNVPPPTSFGRSVAWQSQRCGDNVNCRLVAQVVQAYCTEGRPKRTAADTLNMLDTDTGADGAGRTARGTERGSTSRRNETGGADRTSPSAHPRARTGGARTRRGSAERHPRSLSFIFPIHPRGRSTRPSHGGQCVT